MLGLSGCRVGCFEGIWDNNWMDVLIRILDCFRGIIVEWIIGLDILDESGLIIGWMS